MYIYVCVYIYIYTYIYIYIRSICGLQLFCSLKAYQHSFAGDKNLEWNIEFDLIG